MATIKKTVRLMLSTEANGQGTKLGGCTESNLEISADTIDVSSFDVADFKEYLSGDTEWNISVSGFYTTNVAALKIIKDSILKVSAGNIFVTLIDEVTGEVFSGQCVVENFNPEKTKSEKARKYSFSLKGTGVLEEDIYTP